MSKENKLSRRDLLKAGGAAAVAGLAGCTSVRERAGFSNEGAGFGEEGDSSGTSTDQQGSSNNTGVEVFRNDIVDRIEAVKDWENSEVAGLEWSDVEERRQDLYEETESVEEELWSNDFAEDQNILGTGAVSEYGSGILVYEDTSGSDKGSMFLAHSDHGMRYDDAFPEAIWPNPETNTEDPDAEPMLTPEDAGKIDTEYREFLEDSGIPTDFVEEVDDDRALAIMAEVVPYLGDMDGDNGLQVYDDFVEELVGTPWSDSDGLLDQAVNELRELEDEWVDYIEGGEDNSITRYMREIAGNKNRDGEIDDLRNILENPGGKTETVTRSEYNSSDSYVSVDEASQAIGQLDTVESQIVNKFNQDRKYAAEISMVARALENARDEIQDKASKYVFDEDDEDRYDRDEKDYGGDHKDDKENDDEWDDGREKDLKTFEGEFKAVNEHLGGISEGIENDEGTGLYDEEGKDGVYDLFARAIHERKNLRRGLLPREVWEAIEDDDERIPSEDLRKFWTGSLSRPQGRASEIRAGGYTEGRIEDYDNPGKDVDWNLDYLDVIVSREMDDGEQKIPIRQDKGDGLFEDYVLQYFTQNLDVEYNE